MNTPTLSRPSAVLPANLRFNPDAIRAAVQEAKAKGMLRGPGEAVAIEKNGTPLAIEGKFRSQWIDIDPAMASRWLENNFKNRKCDDEVVNAYARDMLNGTWVATHQGVAFNDRDELIDGQHRLRAIVLSGKTIRMMVTFGLPSKIEGSEMTTMDAVDRGRPRSVADQLKIQHGLKNGSIISSICMSIGNVCYGKRTRRLSVGQTLKIYRAFESAVDWVIIHRPKEHGLRQAGVLAGFAFALATEESLTGGKIACMMERLLTGENLKSQSSMKHLRNFLISDEAKLLSQKTDRGIAELVLQAIYLESKGKPIMRLELAPDGAAHFRAAQRARVEKIAALFQLPKTP